MYAPTHRPQTAAFASACALTFAMLCNSPILGFSLDAGHRLQGAGAESATQPILWPVSIPQSVPIS